MNKTGFYTYLLNKPLTEGVARQHQRHKGRFEKWCSAEGLSDPRQLNYRELMDYVRHLKDKELNVHTINIHIDSVRKYYDYLIEEGVRTDNPIKNLRIKGTVKKIHKNLLRPEALEELYKRYSSKTDHYQPVYHLYHQRNVVILGLIIHQAAHSGDIGRIELKDVDLGEGTIYIPSGKNGKGRTLKLSASQIMPVNTYITVTRPVLRPENEKLIVGRPHSIIAHMLKELKKYNPQVENALQIRASVIVQWLKQYNLRQVQYMCGHTNIGSTEAYKEQDMESLQNELQKHHPFR